MTDTPRTLAAILDLFSDDLSPVSRQDMRDLIVSLTEPVSSGGFPGAQAGEVSLFRIDSSMSPVASSGFAPYVVYASEDLEEDHVWDPLGVRQTEDEYVSASQGDTWPAGSWFVLEQGIYVVRMQVGWTTSDTGIRYAAFLPIDNRVYGATPPVYDHVFWGPGQWDTFQLTGNSHRAAGIVTSGGTMTHITSTVVRVTEAMGPSAYGGMISQDTGSPLALSSGVVMIMRLGDCNAPE